MDGRRNSGPATDIGVPCRYAAHRSTICAIPEPADVPARRSPPERKADLIKLADCLESKYQLLYERAVTYIRILAHGGPQETPHVNRLYFVMHPRSLMLLRPAVGNVELDLNFIPHRLKIVVANR